jgi:hypothetical protein
MNCRHGGGHTNCRTDAHGLVPKHPAKYPTPQTRNVSFSVATFGRSRYCATCSDFTLSTINLPQLGSSVSVATQTARSSHS